MCSRGVKLIFFLRKSLFAVCGYKNAAYVYMSARCEYISAVCVYRLIRDKDMDLLRTKTGFSTDKGKNYPGQRHDLNRGRGKVSFPTRALSVLL